MPGEDEKWWREVLQRLATIEANTKGIDEMSNKASKALNLSETNNQTIRKMQDNMTWLWRSVGALFIAYVVKILFGF
ncbi:MAG: hemolysin XhlA family protein [Enterococcus devriesei]|uniref:hemolysin XhlA family protein n=1 Tax=Enterococcus devriesei TaxID=319970 RepID=UPI003F902FEF